MPKKIKGYLSVNEMQMHGNPWMMFYRKNGRSTLNHPLSRCLLSAGRHV